MSLSCCEKKLNEIQPFGLKTVIKYSNNFMIYTFEKTLIEIDMNTENPSILESVFSYCNKD